MIDFTPAMDDRLTYEWNERLRAGEIADILTTAFKTPVIPGDVIVRADRLGLPYRVYSYRQGNHKRGERPRASGQSTTIQRITQLRKAHPTLTGSVIAERVGCSKAYVYQVALAIDMPFGRSHAEAARAMT